MKRVRFDVLKIIFSDDLVLLIRNVQKSHTLQMDVTIKHFNQHPVKLYLLMNRFINWLKLYIWIVNQDIVNILRITTDWDRYVRRSDWNPRCENPW